MMTPEHQATFEATVAAAGNQPLPADAPVVVACDPVLPTEPVSVELVGNINV